MNIHEYQAKDLLKRFGVPIPEGRMALTPTDAVKAAEEIQSSIHNDKWAVKAQIHAGGRGKGGGVKIASSLQEVEQYASAILGMTLVTHQTGSAGKLVRRLLIEQGIYYPGDSPVKEFYMCRSWDKCHITVPFVSTNVILTNDHQPGVFSCGS